jgi:EpsI family protein
MRKTVILCSIGLFIAAVGFQGVRLWGRRTGRDRYVPLERPLTSVPRRLDGWWGKDVEVDPYVVKQAGADAYLRRNYTHRRTGTAAALYVAYYGRIQDSVPHGPVICYPAAGWLRLKEETVPLKTTDADRKAFQVQHLLYEKENLRQAVVYWYAVNGKDQMGATSVRLQAALQRVLGGASTVIQVMVSTTPSRNVPATFDELEAFTRLVLAELEPLVPRTGQNAEQPSNGRQD